MSICFVICYFGKLPIWFDAFMLSCERNDSINWLIFTDSKIPNFYPKNIEFQYLDLKHFNKLAQKVIEKNIQIKLPYKLCDFKPLYGDIFKNHLNDYDYWGHCDLDLIWGNLEGFFNAINYQHYDIVSTRKNAISGHCTIYKNNETLCKLYKEVNYYWKPLLDKEHVAFDEGYFSYYIYTLLKDTMRLKIYWPKNLSVCGYTLRHTPLGWYWEDGKIFSKNGKERLYLHFVYWKKIITKLDFTFQNSPKKFHICRTGIFRKKENVKLNTNNYPIKTPWHAFKYYLKNLLGIKQPGELSNYPPRFLRSISSD